MSPRCIADTRHAPPRSLAAAGIDPTLSISEPPPEDGGVEEEDEEGEEDSEEDSDEDDVKLVFTGQAGRTLDLR